MIALLLLALAACSTPPPYVAPAGSPARADAPTVALPTFTDLRAPLPDAGAPAAGAHPAPHDGLYHCPMHPQITHSTPGFCPICDMALEKAPAAPATDDANGAKERRP